MSHADAFKLAAQYHAAGNFYVAEQYAQSVLETDPQHAEALHMLGAICWQRGDLVQAVAYLEKSLVCNEANALTWQHLADVHSAAGNGAAAIAHYEQALRLRPDFAEGHNTLGVALLNAGQAARAADCFRQTIRLRPTWAAAYNNLGNALRALGQAAAAVQAFEQALALAPDNPDIAYNLGTIHHVDREELDLAVGYYRQALSLKPAYVAEICNSLGTALKEQGLLDEASAHFRETLRLQPHHAMASYNLSELAGAGRYVFAPSELAGIKALLALGSCTATERILYGFALGTVLDKQKAYEDAFAYFQEANSLKKSLLQESNLAFDAAAHALLVERTMAAYDAPYFERVKHWGMASEVPVFIVGMPRSGSTLVEQILASHAQVFGWGESGAMDRFVNQGKPANAAERYAPLVIADAGAAHRQAADYLQRLQEVGKGATRVTNKSLENITHLGLIATLFPHARIIHCRRQPLDVCLSCYFKNFQDMAFSWSLEDIGAYYRQYEKLLAHWSAVLPTPIHEISYEELVHNQEAVSRQLIAFCGLEWDERCLSFFNTRRVVRTASSVQVRKPMSPDAMGRWQNYRGHLGPLIRALGREDEF